MAAKIPAIYEIDPDTDEANGTVHPFCCGACLRLSRDEHTAEIESRGFLAKVGETELPCDGSICEHCVVELDESITG